MKKYSTTLCLSAPIAANPMYYDVFCEAAERFKPLKINTMSEDKKNLPDNDKLRRETGFYWVRFNDGGWVVAEWSYTYWLLPGYTTERNDNFFMGINENRIIRL